jgi:hypothetical protein
VPVRVGLEIAAAARVVLRDGATTKGRLLHTAIFTILSVVCDEGNVIVNTLKIKKHRTVALLMMSRKKALKVLFESDGLS